MQYFKPCFSTLIILLYVSAAAQMQIDHPIQLTGSGTDAKLSGIQNVTGPQDATSVQSIQNGSFIYGLTTGANNVFILSLSPPTAAYLQGMVFNFISNQTNSGPATLNVDGHGAIFIVKNINQQFTGCEIQTGQAVTVLYDGTNFQMLSASSSGGQPTANAGPNQISLAGTITNLAANTPSSGTGVWAIVSGQGGTIADSANPNSLFTGSQGATYVLSWTVINACGSTSSDVTIAFAQQVHGSQTFSSPSTLNPFVVPNGVYIITIQCYGAQGASNSYANGGNGGYAEGTLAVNPGLTLYVSVGGQTGTNGGGSGGTTNSGGGMSDVRRGSTSFDSVLIVAGGGGAAAGVTGEYGGEPGGTGGGAATGPCANGEPGGGGPGRGAPYSYSGSDGSCTTGGADGADEAGTGNSGGGGGGGLTSGGEGSDGGGYGAAGTNGSFGQGRNYGYDAQCGTSGGPGAGGGGGYYGGGGTASSYCGAGGGGGGSSWASTELSSLTFTGGLQSGNGQVLITW